MESKVQYRWTYLWNKNKLTNIENRLLVAKVEGGEEVRTVSLGLVQFSWGSLVAQIVKRLPTTWETRVWSLGREDPLEKEMATHSSILA